MKLNLAVFRSSPARGERIGAGPFLRAWAGPALVGCVPLVADRFPVSGKCQVSTGLGAPLHMLQARSRSRTRRRRRSGNRGDAAAPRPAVRRTNSTLAGEVMLSLTGIPLLIAAVCLAAAAPLLFAWWWRREARNATGLSALRPLADRSRLPAVGHHRVVSMRRLQLLRRLYLLVRPVLACALSGQPCRKPTVATETTHLLGRCGRAPGVFRC